MPLLEISDPETDRIVRELAARKGVSADDAVREAAERELTRLGPIKAVAPQDRQPLIERIRDLQEEIASYPKTGLKADKEFYDWLSGDQ